MRYAQLLMSLPVGFSYHKTLPAAYRSPPPKSVSSSSQPPCYMRTHTCAVQRRRRGRQSAVGGLDAVPRFIGEGVGCGVRRNGVVILYLNATPGYSRVLAPGACLILENNSFAEAKRNLKARYCAKIHFTISVYQ